MDPFQKILGALRVVVHDGPKQKSWRRGLSLMGQLRQPQQQQIALDYLRGAVEGWPEALRLFTAQDWRKARHRDAPHPIWPLVQCAHLPGCEEKELRRLQSWCTHSPIQHLRVPLDYGGSDIALLTAPAFREHLRSLRLRTNNLRDDDIATLLDKPWPQLEVLDLTGNWCNGDGLVELLEQLPQLRELHLDMTPISLENLRQLARRGHPSLEVLGLRHCTHMRAEALHELERATGPGTPLPRLQKVPVELTLIDKKKLPETTWALWRRWQSPASRNFTLDHSYSPHGVKQALQAGHLDQVEALTLQGTHLANAVMGDLCSSQRLEALQMLKLSHLDLNPTRRQHLERARWAKQLRVLVLERVKTDVVELLGAPSLRGLEVLSLASCELSSEDVVRLASARPSAALRALNLQGIKLDRPAVEALVSSPWCQGLQVCQVNYHLLAPGCIGLVEGFKPMLPQHEGRWPDLWHRALSLPDAKMHEEVRHFRHHHQKLLPMMEQLCPPHLHFHWSRLNSAALLALAQARPRGVQSLSFANQKFPEGTLELLLQTPWVRNLKQLSLINCGLQDQDIALLARWRPTQLKWLVLRHNHDLDREQAQRTLQATPWFTGLEKLVMV